MAFPAGQKKLLLPSAMVSQGSGPKQRKPLTTAVTQGVAGWERTKRARLSK